MKKIAIAAALGGLLLAGCETTSSRPYTPSTQNIIAFQKAVPAGTKVSVADFKAADDVDVEPSCRLLGALEVAPGKTPVEFMQDAFRDELFRADVYSEDGTPLMATITELKPDSVGTGSWVIGLNVASPKNPTGIDVRTDYSFKTSYTAVRACQNVIDAFTPAVQETIGKVIADPGFRSLL